MSDVDLRVVSIDELEPDPENPQVQDLATFNALVESIKADGWLETVTVVELDVDRFQIVGGEHRWKAGKLAGMTTVPILVKPKDQWERDVQRAKVVAMNVMRGRLDPAKFTQLWNDLQQKYGPDAAAKLMGFSSAQAGELKRLVRDTAKQLPAQMRAELERRSDKIRSVEDLQSVVQSLFARYGGTLESSYVMFAYGGRTHLMVKASPSTFSPIRRLAEWCDTNGKSLDEELARAVKALDLPDVEVEYGDLVAEEVGGEGSDRDGAAGSEAGAVGATKP